MGVGTSGRYGVKLRTAWRLFRAGGVRDVASATLARCGFTLYEVFETPTATAASLEPSDSTIFGWLTLDESAAYALHHRAQTVSVPIDERFARGDRCFVARRGSEIVSSRWHAFGVLREEAFRFRFRLGQGDAYVYGVYTSESYRGMGLASAVASRANRDLATQGVTNLLSVVYSDNIPGVRAAMAAGGKRAGILIARGRIGLLLRSGVFPQVSVSISMHCFGGGGARA